MNLDNISLAQLSFLGDAVFDLLVRDYLINQNVVKLKNLQEESLKFVSAKRQAYFLEKLTEDNILTEEELDLVRRGRNIKTHKSPKNCDIITYKHATAFEIMIGYLYKQDKIRLKEIFDLIVKM